MGDYRITLITEEDGKKSIKIVYTEEDQKEIEVIIPVITDLPEKDGVKLSCWEICPLQKIRSSCLEDEYDVCSKIVEQLGFTDWVFDIPDESAKCLFNTLVQLIWPEAVKGGIIKKIKFKRNEKT